MNSIVLSDMTPSAKTLRRAFVKKAMANPPSTFIGIENDTRPTIGKAPLKRKPPHHTDGYRKQYPSVGCNTKKSSNCQLSIKKRMAKYPKAPMPNR